MKQSFKTSKLYYGFPIFILGYQDQNFGYNITTCSSSYSLGDWLVIGVGAEENATDQIKHYQQFTVNIPDENLMLEMEQAGFISHREKLKHLGLDYEISERTQAPILEACPVVLDCQVDRIIEEDGICHIFAKILYFRFGIYFGFHKKAYHRPIKKVRIQERVSFPERTG